jgi:hypothetical protein
MQIGALQGFNTTPYQGANNVAANAQGSWTAGMGNSMMQMGMSGAMMSGMGMGGGGNGGYAGGVAAQQSANSYADTTNSMINSTPQLQMPQMGGGYGSSGYGFAQTPVGAAAA